MTVVLFIISMIQLYEQLVVPAPTNVTSVCGSNANWGYAQINTVILTPGQKYNIQLKDPGYITLSLGYYAMTVSSYGYSFVANFNLTGFNLNDYNNYIGNTNISGYYMDAAGFYGVSTAYAYGDSFTLDLTDLNPQYAVILGLLKFDYISQFNTYSQIKNGNQNTYYLYGLSSALENVFLPNGVPSLQINTNTFLGIPVDINAQINVTSNAMGYRLNYNFLINDETVSNTAFNYPSDQSNVTAVAQNPNVLIQQNGSYNTNVNTLVLFEPPQNVAYYSIVQYGNGQTGIVEAIGSNPSSGIPNTNAINDSNIGIPVPGIGGNAIELKSIYNNNGFNDVWVISGTLNICQPNSTTFYILPPYFNPLNITLGQYYVQLNSTNPDIIYQYIVQPPIVQINTTSTNLTSSQSNTISSATTHTPPNIPSTPIIALVLALVFIGLGIYISIR